jgi:hypothetical protein
MHYRGSAAAVATTLLFTVRYEKINCFEILRVQVCTKILVARGFFLWLLSRGRGLRGERPAGCCASGFTNATA